MKQYLIIHLLIFINSTTIVNTLQNSTLQLLIQNLSDINLQLSHKKSKQMLIEQFKQQYISQEDSDYNIDIDLQVMDQIAFKMVTGTYQARLQKIKRQASVDTFKSSALMRFSTTHDQPISQAQFLYTKKYTAGNGQGAFYMILLMKKGGVFEILDISGKSLATLETEHEYSQIAGNPMNDEYYFVALREDGKMENFEFRYLFNRNRSNKTVESQKKFICSMNRTFEYEQTPDPEATVMTFVLPYLTRGIKYTLAGTHSGDIHVWRRNGSYIGNVDFSKGPVLKLLRFYPSVLAISEHEVGFFRPTHLKKDSIRCDGFSESVVDAVTELASNHIFYVLLTSGEILIYDVKSQQKTCRILSKFNSQNFLKLDLEHPHDYRLQSLKGFLLLSSQRSADSWVFNTTLLGRGESSYFEVNMFSDEEEVGQSQEENGRNSTSVMYNDFAIRNMRSRSWYLHLKTVNGIQTVLTLFDISPPELEKDELQKWMEWAEYPILAAGSILVVVYQLYCRGRKRKSKRRKDQFNSDLQPYGDMEVPTVKRRSKRRRRRY